MNQYYIRATLELTSYMLFQRLMLSERNLNNRKGCVCVCMAGEGWKCKSEYQLIGMGMDILALLWIGSKAMKQPRVESLSMSNVK